MMKYQPQSEHDRYEDNRPEDLSIPVLTPDYKYVGRNLYVVYRDDEMLESVIGNFANCNTAILVCVG
jgi:hypothetical protein